MEGEGPMLGGKSPNFQGTEAPITVQCSEIHRQAPQNPTTLHSPICDCMYGDLTGAVRGYGCLQLRTGGIQDLTS